MRSLSVKLVLAFLITSVVGVGLAAFFIQQLVVNRFDDYLLEQRRSDFVEIASGYYAEHGSWEGINEWLRQWTSTPGMGPPSQGGPGPGRLSFALANTAGVIVASPDPRRNDQPASSEELARSVPVTVNGQTVGNVLALDQPFARNSAEQRYLERTSWALGAAAAIAVGIALVLGIVLARFITRPVRDLTAAVKAIAGGDLYQQVPVQSRDELGQLALQFNRMSDDLARAIHARRRMTADIAHDLRTPLTVIAGYLESLRDEVLKPTPQRFATMYDETQLLLRMVEDLHTLSLADSGELTLTRHPVPPQVILKRVADSFQYVAEQQQVSLHVQAESGLPALYVDENRIARTLGNLMSNALRYTPAGGGVTLEAHQADAGVALVVTDTGSGIPEEHLPNVFERFYRTDRSRSNETGGSGLGLSIVKSIVEAHGGSVDVTSRVGQGTTFTIVLPV